MTAQPAAGPRGTTRPAGPVRTTVHLLRHGEVDNPEGVLYGRLPGYVLSQRGHAMARDAAAALARRPVVHLRTSPLERARQTAAPLAEALGLAAEVDDRLLESTNVFEGTRLGPERGWRHPRHWRHLRDPFAPSWGEDYADVAARVLAAARDARDAARAHSPDGEAVCVAHQLPVWVACRALQGRRLWHHPGIRLCSLASVTSITWSGEDVVRVAYGEPAGEVSRQPARGA